LSKLPLLSWHDVVKVLVKAGFQPVRQKGSHLILVKNEYVVPVPKHKEIKEGLIAGDNSRSRYDERTVHQTSERIIAYHELRIPAHGVGKM